MFIDRTNCCAPAGRKARSTLTTTCLPLTRSPGSAPRHTCNAPPHTPGTAPVTGPFAPPFSGRAVATTTAAFALYLLSLEGVANHSHSIALDHQC